MTSIHVYGLCGTLLFGLGLCGVLGIPHLLRKVIGLNVMGAGVFLIMIAFAHRTSPPDPVPHAMVLTGIVVAISATALALTMIRRLFQDTGRTSFHEPASTPGKEL